MKTTTSFPDPDSAITALAERLATVSQSESVSNLIGRILANPILADRDSPAADVSAMDGYGIRLDDLQSNTPVPVSGESKAGSAPPKMVSGKAIRIFTGAIVPTDCEAVIKREDTDESDSEVQFHQEIVEHIKSGSNIRFQGENSPVGSEVLQPGTLVTTSVAATLSNFGCVETSVYRPVKVAILTTGNEVVDPSTKGLDPWQLRNSNQTSVLAALSGMPFTDASFIQHVVDEPDALAETLRHAIDTCDAVVMTGGVSKGDYDYVPETIATAGGQIVFHGLPIRPGKPILGATTADGKLILGLPGNPVSSTVNAVRFFKPLLSKMSGQANWQTQPALVELTEPPFKAIPLHAMILVRMISPGKAEIVSAKGSGDLVALGKSDGFVSVSPNETSTGPWPYYAW